MIHGDLSGFWTSPQRKIEVQESIPPVVRLMNLKLFNVKRTNMCSDPAEKCELFQIGMYDVTSKLLQSIRHFAPAINSQTRPSSLWCWDDFVCWNWTFTPSEDVDLRLGIVKESWVILHVWWFLCFYSIHLVFAAKSAPCKQIPQEWKVAICNVDHFSITGFGKKQTGITIAWQMVQMVTIPGIPSDLVS